MKKFTIVLFTAVLSCAFLAAPGILEARGGHGGHGGHGGRGGSHGGFHGGSWGGHYGGYYGGYRGGFYRGPRYYGGPIVGFGAAYYIAPWGWYYPGYYPEYYYNVPPAVYDQPPAIEAPPPEYIEPPPATQGSGPGYVFLLHLRPARFHQILIREDVKFGRRPGSITMNRAGIHRSK